MESTIFSYLDKDRECHQAIGAVAYRHNNGSFHGSLLNDFELLIIVVCQDIGLNGPKIEHCASGGTHYQLMYVDRKDLENWIISGENSETILYFLRGEIIWDIEGELKSFRTKLLEFNAGIRMKRKFKEFAKFLRQFVEAKKHAGEGHLIDAYYCVIEALRHFARIELIDEGFLPENSVWEQVRPLNSVVYKLFDELMNGSETLEQRIQLALLACEFSITSKMTDCCSVLFKILSSRKEAWSIQELLCVPDLEHVREELPIVLRKLVYRSLVSEITLGLHEDHGGTREIRYRV